MTDARLRFASDLLRRLGEELTPSPVNGIVELVKNSYDANASQVEVTLQQPVRNGDDLIPGSLTISDNGDGMTTRDFTDGWLVLGRSRKDATKPTRLGRRPAGDKGLGRLTALRMGKKVSVSSVARSTKGKCYEIDLDWRSFDKSATPDQVPLVIKERDVPKSQPQGTKVTVSGIERRLDAYEVERLSRSLLLISNPFKRDSDSFSINFKISPEPRTLIQGNEELFKAAVFRIDAEVMPDLTMRASIYDGIGSLLSSTEGGDLAQRFKDSDASQHALVPAKLQIWIYIFKEEHYEKGRKMLSTLRAWLKDFGGIHIFQNGMRVGPYGDPNDDWTGMNALRASSPELSPTTRTSIGYLSFENQPAMVQKTDRSGFIESATFGALREFVRSTLRWQQSFRISQRQKIDEIEEVDRKRSSEVIAEKISSMFSSLDPTREAQARSLVSELKSISERRETALRREIELYRTLGTAGIAASVFAHEASNNQLARIQDNVDTICHRVGNRDRTFSDTVIQPIANGIRRDIASLESISGVTLSLIKSRKRKTQRIDATKSVNSVIAQFSAYSELHGISIPKANSRAGIFVLGSLASFECALTNLITNAIQAIGRDRPDEPLIVVGVDEAGPSIEISVSDNGPGIQDISIADLWLPGETTREDGTGLGLAIVRAAARDLGGSVSAEKSGNYGGATFTLRLPLMNHGPAK